MMMDIIKRIITLIEYKIPWPDGSVSDAFHTTCSADHSSVSFAYVITEFAYTY